MKFLSLIFFIITISDIFLEMLDEYPITDSITVFTKAVAESEDDDSFVSGNEVLIFLTIFTISCFSDFRRVSSYN